MRFHRLLIVALASASLAAAPAGAQTAAFHWQKALPAGSTVQLHNINGNIVVTPSTANQVEIIGRLARGSRDRDTSDIYVEVHEYAGGVVACVMWRHADGECSEDHYSIHNDNRWDDDGDMPQIDLEIHLPAGMQVSAGSVSGDVDVNGATGNARVRSVSGNVRFIGAGVSQLSAKSVSGDVSVQVSSLTGTGDFDAGSVSGNITLTLPAKFDADLSMRTVSGDLDSDFPITLTGRRRGRMEGKIGAGGRQLTLATVSGDVRLVAAK